MQSHKGITYFEAARRGSESLAALAVEAEAGWRRNNPGTAPTHVFLNAGATADEIASVQLALAEGKKATPRLEVSLRRDIAPGRVCVGVHKLEAEVEDEPAE